MANKKQPQEDKRAADAHYLAEMQIWIKQQENRVASCDRTIADLQEHRCSQGCQILLTNEAIKLEREQKRIIRRRITKGRRELKQFLTKKKTV